MKYLQITVINFIWFNVENSFVLSMKHTTIINNTMIIIPIHISIGMCKEQYVLGMIIIMIM